MAVETILTGVPTATRVYGRADSSGLIECTKTDGNGALLVALTATGTPIGTLANPMRVDPTGTTTQPVSIVAGSALIGKVSIDQTTPGTTNRVVASTEINLYNGATALTLFYATVVASTSGANTIIAAVSSKQIRVLALQLVANAAVNAKWQSHITPTDLTGLAYFAANGGYVLSYNPAGWFQTISGEALDLNLSGNVAVGGSITYVTI